jgi:hypothetical protein
VADRVTSRAPEAVERAADELYGLPLPDFTKARDELARRLRQEGLRDEANAVKALRKPTVGAWALNQLAQRRSKEVERLLSTGKRLRDAQAALLAGGDRAALQRASAEERELVDKLTRDATAVAGEAGTGGTASLDERIRATLHAAALDEETAAELAAGRLVREREAAGLFGAASAAPRPAGKAAADRSAVTGKRSNGKEPKKVAERRRKLERELESARAEERKAQREHAAAAKAAERAGKQARETRRRADEALHRAKEADAGLREAERRARDAAMAYDRATRAVASAEKKL